MWSEDEIYIDDENSFKQALGGKAYRNVWLMKPSVIAAIVRARILGMSQVDLNSKTSILGGTIVVKDGQVVFEQREGSSFNYADPEDILAL